jgi:predicted nucleotidyltransferase/predicted transcriptional regulator
MVKKLKDKKEILKAFNDLNNWRTIKQISKEVKLSYQPTYTYLAELGKEGILNHKREGNMHFYSLNLKNKNVVREMENIEFEKSQKFMKHLDEKVSLALNEFLEHSQKNLSVRATLLFGSTARKTRAEKSDIDIFAVAGDKDEAEIKRICNTLNMKYNIKLSPVVVSLNEFRKMLIERNDFTKNLINDKIILYGSEFYFSELIKSMEQLKWI